MICHHKELEELCHQIDTTGWFALDMEFIPERTYKPELCLVQVAVEDNAYLIDPLPIKDLSCLWKRVASPDILVILHAAEQDLLLIHHLSGLLPNNIFDTQIAAGFAGFGYPIGYGKLVHQLLKVNLAKTESYSDWLNRPLTEAQINYALDDVRYLFPIYQQLVERLQALGRLSWAQEECLKYSSAKYFASNEMMRFLKIKGASNLSRRGLAVLQSICEWREQQASQQNRPPRSILADNTLLEISRRTPVNITEMQQIRGIRLDQIKAVGAPVLEAIKQGLAIPDNQCPVWPSSKIPSKREVLWGDLLFMALKIICNNFDLAPELVSTRSDLQVLVKEHCKGNRPEFLPLLNGWRYDLAGKTLLSVLDGASLEMKMGTDDVPIEMKINYLH